MKFVKLFEEYKISKSKKIFKHKDKGGVSSTIGELTNKKTTNALEDIIESLVKRFNIKGKVKYINSGTFGMAFVIKDKVIKLTSNKSEANIAKGLIGENIPNCVKYYDIIYLSDYKIWAILMDKAEKLSKQEKSVVEILTSSFAYTLSDFNKVKDKMSDIKISDDKLKKLWEDYMQMYSSLNDNNISLNDLHEDNIGYLNGTMVHFDIMGGSSTDVVGKISKIR